MTSLDEMVKLGKEMDAGSLKSISRKGDGTPLLAICIYYESDELDAFLKDLEKLEEKYGYGE